MIHNLITFANNISKLTTPLELSPYLQMPIISNQLLTPILILHMYMPTHDEDIHVIPLIQQNITQMLNTYSNHFPLLTIDINRTIFLVEHQTRQTTSTPSRKDIDLKNIPVNSISYQSPTQHTPAHSSCTFGQKLKTIKQHDSLHW